MMKNETKVCKRCGTEYPLKKFQLMKPKNRKPYRINTCNKCRYSRKMELKNKLSEDVEILIPRQYKIIPPQRVLNVQEHGIALKAEDEIFVRMTDYKDLWISNYGRAIKRNYGKYNLLKGRIDKYGYLSYHVKKEI